MRPATALTSREKAAQNVGAGCNGTWCAIRAIQMQPPRSAGKALFPQTASLSGGVESLKMTRIDNLFDRVVETKMELNHQNIVDRINNRHKEDVPPLFWIGVVLMALLVMSNWLG